MTEKTYSARDLQIEFNYAKWENFNGLIKRAINIINSGIRLGMIVESKIEVNTGKGAIRKINNYIVDENAYKIIKELSLSYKTSNFYSFRNETLILSLIKKYFNSKNIEFIFQKRIHPFVFDALVGNTILVEFDEIHHQNSKKQISIDSKKNAIASVNGYKIIRLNLDMDIIDCIITINNQLENQENDNLKQ